MRGVDSNHLNGHIAAELLLKIFADMPLTCPTASPLKGPLNDKRCSRNARN
jgi:hypothetical protein